MNYLARSDARAGSGLGFEYTNHPHSRHHQRRSKGQSSSSSSSSSSTSSIDSRGNTKKKKEDLEYNWCPIEQLDKAAIRTMLSERTMSTALCIVPDDEHWDSLQRARFMARDHTYQQWPPAIRLFHPFAPRAQLPNAATAIADVIERHNIEPFEITLDQVLILPHFEVLDEQMDAEAEMVRRHGAEAKAERISAEEAARKEAREQIEEESRRSLERKKRRKPWSPRKPPNAATSDATSSGDGGVSITKAEDQANTSNATTATTTMNGVQNANITSISGATNDSEPRSTNARLSPQELLDKQRAAKSEFNGPCVICLEPNDETKRKLEDLRELLRAELFGAYDPFSVSSGVSSTNNLPRTVEKKHKKLSKGIAARKGKGGPSFRPVLALARVPSVTAAVAVARNLQALWEPLTFNVTDLSIISRSDGDGPSDSYGFDNRRSNVSIRRMQGTELESESALLSSKGRFGCDALVSLMGAESFEEGDANGESEILDLLLSEAGEAGGADAAKVDYEALLALSDEEEHIRKRQARVRLDEDEREYLNDLDDEEDWNHWLTDDEEWDEGATIVIGRTQFFVGEARQYVGMPAMSATDGKGRVLGEGVSAAARRRGSVHRKGERWDDGDFGRKERDIRPG